MKTLLVIGLGRFGSHIVKKLYELNHQVMAVDSDEARVNASLPFVTDARIGDSTSKEFLSSLGIPNYDACIVAIGDNFQNSLETTDLLKVLGAKKVIARASRGIQEKFLLRNGADEVVYPEKQLAIWTAIRCTSYHILDYIELDGEHSIYEVDIPQTWEGKSVLELNIRSRYHLNILGIRSQGKLSMDISPDTVFHKGSSVLVLGQPKDVHKCFQL